MFGSELIGRIFDESYELAPVLAHKLQTVSVTGRIQIVSWIWSKFRGILAL